MGADGLPWRRDIHDGLLTELLGPRPAPGMRPRRLAELAEAIRAALHGRAFNPDSPAQLVRAFAAEGISLTSTRAHVLRAVDHPAVPLLLEYKELARLYAADGWGWLDTWVSDGRFRPEYVVGGVVSGRWASRGGGALQIPKVLRRAVVADPGWVLVVADAAQLEPRVLAALAGDRAFAQAAAQGDVYAALAGALGGERDKAKVALLSAMYGGAGGEAGQLLAVLRKRFPRAARYVDDAATAGEEGRLVRSRLGRTCPPPSAQWRELTGDGDDPRAGRVLRSRGRFTRNFVVQASAADWAAVLLASLRRRLASAQWPTNSPQLSGQRARPQISGEARRSAAPIWCSFSMTRSSCTARPTLPMRSSRAARRGRRGGGAAGIRPGTGAVSAERLSGHLLRRRQMSGTASAGTPSAGTPSAGTAVRAQQCGHSSARHSKCGHSSAGHGEI